MLLNVGIIDSCLMDAELYKKFIKNYTQDAKFWIFTKCDCYNISKFKEEFSVLLINLDSIEDNVVGEFLQNLQKKLPSVPIIVISDKDYFDFGKEILKYGAADFLIKNQISPYILHKSLIKSIEFHNSYNALKKTEARYFDLFQKSLIPMYILDPSNLKFLDVNEATLHKYGYTREEFLKLNIFDIRPAEEKERLVNKLNSSYLFSENIHDIFVHKKKNGEKVYVEIYSNVIEYKDKQARLVMANDVTLRINHINFIENQNRTLQDIARIQSHDVRAPLAKMMYLIDEIKESKVEIIIDGQNYIDLLNKSFSEFNEIIKDLVIKSNSIKV